MVLWDKVQIVKRLPSNTRKPDTRWRPEPGLFRSPKIFPAMRKGRPLLTDDWNPSHKFIPRSFRLYKGVEAPKIPVDKDSSNYHEDNLHVLLGKFQFEAKGQFHDKGEPAEKEIFQAAFDLHLVGWLKVRSDFVLGHVQGDTFALSYFRKYLEEKHLSREAGDIDWVRLWNVNTGLQAPLEYKILFCEKDKRRYKNKKVHILAQLEKDRIREFQEKASHKALNEAEETYNA
eukprot:CAMPEP_0206444312 /NCGR_PEP_ID=MMETSP0324_2-20121206/14843_1 /ASSEMBLY_ACC=CAM_ASM_000836 /TAXON_ID=2866 /ORGANISM="Crypthecodinium cohnii, Strain Seligo" /LENGTH=230 /DNA_ID=CAMNT_0053912323 /DNA_START=130 /DNA_END=822 /DNA_ORIENTATION=+